MKDSLKTYKAKRDFSITPEPAEGGVQGEALSFVIQKHWSSRLHYDFRLELDGAMKSWAVPKGPSYDTHDKRMAVHVEDHPISYNDFEGTIPPKQYGAGKVIIWDKGSWHPLGDPRQGYRQGNLKFELRGHKMHGHWVLVRMKGRGEKQEPWLLIKENDDYARPAAEFSVVDEMPDSVKDLGMPASTGDKAVPRAAALPTELAPQLATLVDAPPTEPEQWLFEVKYDGYRLLARVDGRKIRLMTRNGNDWTHKLELLRAELASMKLPAGWYDGEIVVHNENGLPDFGLLQQAFDGERTESIAYFLFDVPYLNGYDLRHLPFEQRRELLQTVLEKSRSDKVRLSAILDAQAADIVKAACSLGLEGVIGKRRDAPYVSRRSAGWIKLKCGQRQEFVIGGYTDPRGARTGIGSLLLGYFDEGGKLHYAGNVGSGFNESALRELKARLKRLHAADSPFAASRSIGKKAHWVKPALVAEVSFGEWTRSGSVRHAVFQGLRSDKQASAVRRERPAHTEDIVTDKPQAKARAAQGEGGASAPLHGKLPASLKISNPGRVIDAASGSSKIDLVRYYALVAPLMLEHLKGRPVALVRAPAGVGGELFFQKHAESGKLAGVKSLPQELDPEHAPMLEVATARGLLESAQWNVVEFHTQNALGRNYEKPNRMVFDLDPGEGVAWPQMQEAAQLLHAFLDELGLQAFLKTSGGKGLHAVVPIKPYYGWDTVKAFSKAIVEHMAQTLPERFANKSGPKNRVGKIFIDYLRNGRSATTVCAWSARSRPGLGISVPCGWDELAALRGADQWTIHNVHTRLDQGNTPWSGYGAGARGVAPAMKALGFTP
ncbi:DNA ligase D [Massilia sp. NR 4-1]|uniref:DNA ligase D n=1 Tax=Massilia sp. NR 4-1 TaxID=1678028 RepID=UPI00067C1B41|nr:DNA ligase D [Massilia sp. NR 4-1]AKU21481.1 ATP-dependent DNA ligase [Massilia sp. NR 4-1]